MPATSVLQQFTRRLNPVSLAALAFWLAGALSSNACIAEHSSTQNKATEAAASTSVDPSARFAIESMLRDLATACMAGDTDGYMKHVSQGDREFLNEQWYFARDLAKKPASECQWTISELNFNNHRATGLLTIEWTMLGAKPRSVSFDVAFEQLPAEESGVWRYAGETWKRHEAPGVLVLFDPQFKELPARVADAFLHVRSHVEAGFLLTNKQLSTRTQKLKLYKTMKHLQASICLSYVDGLSGWNEPGESIKLLAREQSTPKSLHYLIAHEYGHVATFELGPKANEIAWWILEGVAELSAESWGTTSQGIVSAWATHGRLAPWEEITNFETVRPKWRGHVYSQGHHMLGYISESFGREKRVAWLSALAAGATLDSATFEQLKLTFEQLDRNWRASLPAAEGDVKRETNPTPHDE